MNFLEHIQDLNFFRSVFSSSTLFQDSATTPIPDPTYLIPTLISASQNDLPLSSSLISAAATVVATSSIIIDSSSLSDSISSPNINHPSSFELQPSPTPASTTSITSLDFNSLDGLDQQTLSNNDITVPTPAAAMDALDPNRDNNIIINNEIPQNQNEEFQNNIPSSSSSSPLEQSPKSTFTQNNSSSSSTSELLLKRLFVSFTDAVLQQTRETDTPDRRLGAIVLYLVSPFSILCICMALILNRTVTFATTRRPVSLSLLYRLMLRSLAIYLLLNRINSILQAISCAPGESLFKLLVPSIFKPKDIKSCPNPSILWDLYWSICVGHFIETFSNVVQGRHLYSEAGMTLFEYSMAFQEVQSSQFMTMEVLIFSLISSISLITSHIFGAFNLQDYRLIPSTFFGLLFLFYFAYSVVVGHLLYFPVVCIIGYIPQLILCTVISICAVIYGLACFFTGGSSNLRISFRNVPIAMSEDFYTCLVKISVVALTTASKATYLNESAVLPHPLLTWVEAEQKKQLEQKEQENDTMENDFSYYQVFGRNAANHNKYTFFSRYQKYTTNLNDNNNNNNSYKNFNNNIYNLHSHENTFLAPPLVYSDGKNVYELDPGASTFSKIIPSTNLTSTSSSLSSPYSREIPIPYNIENPPNGEEEAEENGDENSNSYIPNKGMQFRTKYRIKIAISMIRSLAFIVWAVSFRFAYKYLGLKYVIKFFLNRNKKFKNKNKNNNNISRGLKRKVETSGNIVFIEEGVLFTSDSDSDSDSDDDSNDSDYDDLYLPKSLKFTHSNKGNFGKKEGDSSSSSGSRITGKSFENENGLYAELENEIIYGRLDGLVDNEEDEEDIDADDEEEEEEEEEENEDDEEDQEIENNNGKRKNTESNSKRQKTGKKNTPSSSSSSSNKAYLQLLWGSIIPDIDNSRDYDPNNMSENDEGYSTDEFGYEFESDYEDNNNNTKSLISGTKSNLNSFSSSGGVQNYGQHVSSKRGKRSNLSDSNNNTENGTDSNDTNTTTTVEERRKTTISELYDLLIPNPSDFLALLSPQTSEQIERRRLLVSHLQDAAASVASSPEFGSSSTNTTTTNISQSFSSSSTITTTTNNNNHLRHRYLNSQLIVQQRHKPAITRSKYRTIEWDETNLLLQTIEERRKKYVADDEVRETLCVVCQCNPRQVVLWPCRCFALCEDCRLTLAVKNFKGCVCCRRNVKSFSRVFVP